MASYIYSTAELDVNFLSLIWPHLEFDPRSFLYEGTIRNNIPAIYCLIIPASAKNHNIIIEIKQTSYARSCKRMKLMLF